MRRIKLGVSWKALNKIRKYFLKEMRKRSNLEKLKEFREHIFFYHRLIIYS